MCTDKRVVSYEFWAWVTKIVIRLLIKNNFGFQNVVMCEESVKLLCRKTSIYCYLYVFFFCLAALGDKIVRDIRPGAAFEPTYIYRLLTVIKSSLSEKVWLTNLWLL